jgi:hypothetical protein
MEFYIMSVLFGTSLEELLFDAFEDEQGWIIESNHESGKWQSWKAFQTLGTRNISVPLSDLPRRGIYSLTKSDEKYPCYIGMSCSLNGYVVDRIGKFQKHYEGDNCPHPDPHYGALKCKQFYPELSPHSMSGFVLKVLPLHVLENILDVKLNANSTHLVVKLEDALIDYYKSIDSNSCVGN